MSSEMSYNGLIGSFANNVITCANNNDESEASKFYYTLLCEKNRLTAQNKQNELVYVEFALSTLNDYAHGDENVKKIIMQAGPAPSYTA